MTSDRFAGDWVLLPCTKRWPGERGHRPNPDNPALTMCGRKTAGGVTQSPHTTRMRQCPACNVAIGRARKAAKRAKRRAVAPPPETPKPPQPRGGSIRTVSGGLPGLGKR